MSRRGTRAKPAAHDEEAITSPPPSDAISPPLAAVLAAEKLQCGICWDDVTEQGALDSCAHTFCFKCIMHWSKTTNSCPMCKGRFRIVTPKDIVAPAAAQEKEPEKSGSTKRKGRAKGSKQKKKPKRKAFYEVKDKEQEYRYSREELEQIALANEVHDFAAWLEEDDSSEEEFFDVFDMIMDQFADDEDAEEGFYDVPLPHVSLHHLLTDIFDSSDDDSADYEFENPTADDVIVIEDDEDEPANARAAAPRPRGAPNARGRRGRQAPGARGRAARAPAGRRAVRQTVLPPDLLENLRRPRRRGF